MQRRVQIQSWTPGAVRTNKRKGTLSQQPQEQQIKSPQSTWCTLHLWNTWIDNKSSRTEEVDFGSNDIYIFFPFISICECVCICFCVWFCLYSFAFTTCPRVLSACFFFYGLKIFFLNNYFFILMTFYFILIYFILSSSFFLFFLPFILSHVEDRLLVLQPGIRAVALRWESQVQETGPQETSQLHVISNSKNLPETSISSPRPSSIQGPASYSAGHPMPNN